MHEPNRRPAALASLGARSVSLTDPDLMVLVDHSQLHTNQPSFDISSGVEALPFTERVAFSFGGVQMGSLCRFRGGDTTPLRAVFRPVDHALIDSSSGVKGIALAYGAEMRHNVGFLYDSRSTVEVLMTVDIDHPPTSVVDGLGLTSVLASMSGAAARIAKAPILFLQSPVAPHNDPHTRYRLDGAGERARSGQRFALRMAVGMDTHDVASRIQMLEALRIEAERWGFGLQVADRRLGRHRGEWWTLCSPNAKQLLPWRDTVRARLSAEPSLVDGAVQRVRLLSIVGAARTGSSLAVLGRLANASVAILGGSITAMHETAFIHLIVADPIARPDNGDGPLALHGSAHDIIGAVERDCGVKGEAPTGVHQGDANLLSGYQAVATGPFAFNANASTDAFALWVAWDFPRASLSEDVVKAVTKELFKTRKVAQCNLGYRRERVSAAWVRGRAKLDVVLKNRASSSISADVLTQVALDAQEAVARRLDQPGGNGIRLDWRERRLGSWESAPL